MMINTAQMIKKNIYTPKKKTKMEDYLLMTVFKDS